MLVHGATGAIGSAAVQLLVDMGAHVIATAPTAHVELVRRPRAHRVIDHERRTSPGAARVVDAVLDMVGKSTFGACRRILTPDGVYVSSDLGPFGQNLALPAGRPGWAGGRRVVFPFPMETPEVLEHLRSRLESGAFRPVLDRTYPLEEIVDAYRYVESGRKVGNVVIAVTRGLPDPRYRTAAHDEARQPARHGIRRADDLEAGLARTSPSCRRTPSSCPSGPVGSTGWASTAGAPLAAAYATAPSMRWPVTPCLRWPLRTTTQTMLHTGRSSTGRMSLERASRVISDRGPMLHQPTGVPSR